MTRMLFWNVEQFGDDRFYSASGAPDPLAGGLTQQQSSVDRQTLLYNVLTAANPDVIVIVEVKGLRNPNSRLARNNGGVSALVSLLGWLRGNGAPPALMSNEWRLVPPFWLAGAAPAHAGLETVGVLYRGVTGAVQRYFTGPNIWPGAVNVQPQLPGAAAPGAYTSYTAFGNTVDIPAMLVPPTAPPLPPAQPRQIPAGALHNPGLFENTVAARFKLLTAAPAVGVAPAFVNFGAARPPLMVTLTEDHGGGVLRDLTLFAVHAPADNGPALQFLQTLATAWEMSSALGGNETRLVGGDFNLNLLDGAGASTVGYQPVTALGYDLLLAPAGAAPPQLDVYKGFFTTHFQKVSDVPVANPAMELSRFLWSETITPLVSPYPGYGYRSGPFYSLDNVLVRPRVALHNYQTTIMNTVVGSPLNGIGPPPGGAPTGTLAIASAMANLPVASTPWPVAPNAAPFVLANANQLLAWPAYGHVVSTTDHFALFVDV